ncbi:MAG: DUF262 domain-containing protein [Clostridiaceae bacterium]|nr:DUF262 domain-containing protein [Clostridiaceae bacterium]MBW4860369.1 DUF262 domain-containing protein [Clostridiaceae bacterium]MBW4867184.1 DUF262 domain-containing protein [Clostridiaceae bacterium]
MSSDLKEQISLLKKQIDSKKYGLYVDSYPMSLLELVNLYSEGDINLKAQYQRNFKWTDEQKTRLIESLFLGLPIPPIFLYQDENAMWEVVDGIQRLSTVFQFFGRLKKNDKEYYDPLQLTEAPELTYLENLTYEKLPKELQREFKKLRFDLIIISKKSDQDVKLEIFRRLNGFGTKLTPQELRNALIILANPDFFDFIDELSNFEPFLNCISLNEMQENDKKKKEKIEEQIKDKKHYEYVIRYLVLREKNVLLNYPSKSDDKINELFDKAIIKIINENLINFYEEKKLFKDVFVFLDETLGSNSFKKFYHDKGKYQQQTRESIFEVIVPGLAQNLDYYKIYPDTFEANVKKLYLENSPFELTLKPNPRVIDRMKKLIEISEEIFNKNE